jgi:hypothetical protein
MLFEKFRAAFEQVAQTLLTPADLTRVIETDGDLELSEINMELAEYLESTSMGARLSPTVIQCAISCRKPAYRRAKNT